MLELLLVEPRLVGLDQSENLTWLHVAGMIFIEYLEHLLKLQWCHVNLIFLLVVPVHQ